MRLTGKRAVPPAQIPRGGPLKVVLGPNGAVEGSSGAQKRRARGRRSTRACQRCGFPLAVRHGHASCIKHGDDWGKRGD